MIQQDEALELLKFAAAAIKTLKFVRAGQFHEYRKNLTFTTVATPFKSRLRPVLQDQSKHIANCKASLDKTSKYILHRIQTIKERVQAQVLTQDKQSSPRTEMLTCYKPLFTAREGLNSLQ